MVEEASHVKRAIPTLLAVIVFIGLFMWVRANGFDGKVDEEEAPSKEEKVWAVDKKEIEAVTIEREADTLKFEKGKKAWQAAEPKPFPTSDMIVDTFVLSLAHLQGEPIQKGDQDEAGFGFDSPLATVTFTLAGEKAATCLIGTETPIGNKRYVRVKGEEAIYMVDQTMLDQVFDPASDFMEKKLWDLDVGNIQSLSLTWKDEAYELQKAKGKWKIGKEDMTEENVKSIIAALNFLSADDLPVSEQPQQSDFQLTINTEEGSEEWIGATHDEQVTVWKKGGKWVYPLAQADVENAVQQVGDIIKEQQNDKESK